MALHFVLCEEGVLSHEDLFQIFGLVEPNGLHAHEVESNRARWVLRVANLTDEFGEADFVWILPGDVRKHYSVYKVCKRTVENHSLRLKLFLSLQVRD